MQDPKEDMVIKKYIFYIDFSEEIQKLNHFLDPKGEEGTEIPKDFDCFCYRMRNPFFFTSFDIEYRILTFLAISNIAIFERKTSSLQNQKIVNKIMVVFFRG